MQQAAVQVSRDELAALRGEVAALRDDIHGLQATIAELRRIVQGSRILNPIEEDYARRARTYAAIRAIYCWDSKQGPHFVTLVDADDQTPAYAVYALQAELGAAHLTEAYVFDQTLTLQHLSEAGMDIAGFLGDGARLIFQREE